MSTRSWSNGASFGVVAVDMWEIALVDFDVRGADDFAELLRRAADRLGALCDQGLASASRAQHLVELGIQARDDALRRVCRRRDAEPGGCDVAGNARLLSGRQIGRARG